MSEIRKIATRLFVDATLVPEDVVPLGEKQAHQVRNVLRLDDGATLALFNGRDGEWEARLKLEKRHATARILRLRRPQAAAADIQLCFAPLKHARTDFLIEKASELGVGALRPILTARTQTSRINLEAMAQTAREAAEQCERLTVPSVAPPCTVQSLAEGWQAGRTLYVCAELGQAAPVASAFATRGSIPSAILIGPEGGFTPEEMERLLQCPQAVPIGLGPRLLRAETAALAALACWQATCGEWVAGLRPHADVVAGPRSGL